MTTNWSTVFGTLGPELKNQRKVEAVFENFHFTDSSSYSKRLVSDIYDDSNVVQEAAHNVASTVYEKSVVPSMANLGSTLRQAFETGWFPVLDSAINTNPSDKSVGAIAYAYDGTLNDGSISILTRGGRWGALRQKMIAERKVILANALSFGSITPVAETVGIIDVASISGSDHTLPGVLSILCTDDTVEAPKFTVLNTLTRRIADQSVGSSADGIFSLISADNTVQLNKTFQDGPLGISLNLIFGADVSEILTDPESLVEASPAALISNPTEADTNKGKIYIRIARRGAEPTWGVLWSRDAAFTDSVTTTTVPHSAPAVSMVGPNGTGVQFTINNTTADALMPNPGDYTDTIVFDFRVPRLNDQWEIAITNDQAGLFATKIARLYRASINSAPAKPSAAPTAALAGAGAGNVDNGTHTYSYSYVINGVETGASGASGVVTVVDKTANGKVNLTGVTVGPSGTTARKMYRTIAGNTGDRLFVGTISDNVTTTFQDNLADSGLGIVAVEQIDDTLATSVSMS